MAEAHRGKGWGKRLFGELAQIAKDRDCGRIEWRVLKVSLTAMLGNAVHSKIASHVG